MKIVVIGGSGFLGAKLVSALRDRGHEVLAASPRSSVNSVTGEGLPKAMADADVVVDVTNPPSLDGDKAMAFFQASGRNLIAAGEAAGVAHHIVLSIVGVDRLASGYFYAKLAQEELIRASAILLWHLRARDRVRRAGQLDPPTLIAGLDTVDTTASRGGSFGHADFIGPARDDLRGLLWLSQPPTQRCVLHREDREPAPLWTFSPSAPCDTRPYRIALWHLRRDGNNAAAALATTAENTSDSALRADYAAAGVILATIIANSAPYQSR